MTEIAYSILGKLQSALGGARSDVDMPDGESLTSRFAVTDLAQASIGAAAAALSALIQARSAGPAPQVSVPRRLASAWFVGSLRPVGWAPPAPWDAIAGDYETADGWIRLHTNAPLHRAAVMRALGVPADRQKVASAVGQWRADQLEAAVVAEGGAAAAMKSLAQWGDHPQGRAVSNEALVLFQSTDEAPALPNSIGSGGRPLLGLRVLDLTRVLAGPVSTRLLAGWGAEVLRIDSPDWNEPAIEPEVTLGKRCARLDLTDRQDRASFEHLLEQADVLVSGYRSDALDALGFGADVRRQIRPGLIDVRLNAYGWSGPWARRRGFDSLVQMSSGIAEAGMRAFGSTVPTPLPVQALDHATGYLLAGAAISGVLARMRDGHGSEWRTSLAGMARVLVDAGVIDIGAADSPAGPEIQPAEGVERTAWGDALRLPPPVQVQGAPLRWDIPARPLGSDEARWQLA